MRRYTLTVSEVLNWNGIKCASDKTEIVFETPLCGDIVCIPAQNIITIEIPDGCEESCFYGVVSCTEPCDGCGDRRIKICPCESNTDCGPCQKCFTAKNVCVDSCAPGEICSEECGGCAECDSENPCTGGKICQGCKCVCPPSSPYLNANGNCIDCAEDNHCPPCFKCTEEGCKPIVCSEGVCDPSTRDCVECVTRNDCKKPNECCSEGKQCVCCPGYERNANGDCVPVGCTSDEECGPCETCDIPNRKCKPITCPPGQVCVPGKGCMPICDCDSPLCDGQNACVRLNESICYCSSCEGSCADGKPCGPGCYCDKSDMKCKPNPCKGSCENGTDCGPGCGCNPVTKQCEPCASRNCNESCNDLLGCYCPDNVSCRDIPDCLGDCSTKNDCPPGCGCFRGKCVRCENFTCADCEGVDGCFCDDSQNCISDNDRNCKDDAVITKNNENCSITAYFDIKSPCSCPVISTSVGHLNFGTNAGVLNTTLYIQLRKGFASDRTSFNLLPSLDILPESGTIKIVTYAVYKDGQTVNPRVKVGEKTTSLSGVDALSIDSVNLGQLTIGTSTLYRYEVEVFLSSKLKFANNCEYDTKMIAKITGLADLSSPSVNSVVISDLTSQSVRNPIVSWYKALPGDLYGQPFRKAFIGKGGDGRYFDTLFGPEAFDEDLGNWPLFSPEGKLYAGYNYKASTDCGCEDASINDVTFCNLDNFNYTLSEANCRKTLTVSSAFNPCPINQTNPAWNLPSNAKTTFELYVNDVLEYTWENGIAAGFTVTVDSTITKVHLVQKLGTKVVCTKEYTHANDLENPVVNMDCNVINDPNVINVVVNQVAGSNKVNMVEFGLKTGTGYTFPASLNQYQHSGIYTTNVTRNIGKHLVGSDSLIIRATYTNGCSKIIELAKCNATVILDLTPNNISYANCTPSGSNPNIEVTAIGFDSNVKYAINNGSLQTSNVFSNVGPGVHVIRVTDGVNEKFVNAEIFPAVNPVVYFTNPSICINQSTTLVVEAPTGTIFNIQTPTQTLTNVVVANNRYELFIPYGPNVAGNYIVSLVSTNTQICNNFVTTIPLSVGGQALTPTIEIMPGTYCVGQPIPFRIVNGGGATFSVSANGTGLISPPAVLASNTSYNGIYTPSTPNGMIQITGIAPGTGNDCNTTTTPSLLVTSGEVPTLQSVNSVCNPNNSHTITVTVLNATSVIIAGVAATNSSPGVWTRTATGLTGPITITMLNGSCSLEHTHELQNCSCPAGTLQIEGDGNVCGADQVVFDYSVFFNQTPDGTWNFVWQTYSGGVWSDVGTEAAFDNLNPPQFVYYLNINQSVTARLKMRNTVNNCIYYSNEITQMAYAPVAEPVITMTPNPASVGQSVTFSTAPGFTTYQWKINGVNVGTNQNSYTYIPNTSGSVTVRVDVTDSNGCTNFKQTAFTIDNNCPDIPIFYVPSGPCANISIQVTNPVGLLNYTYSGTGSLATPLTGSGVVPGTNTITVDASALQIGEEVTSLDFVFTYNIGSSPTCTVNKTVTFSYERCALNFGFIAGEANAIVSICGSGSNYAGVTFNFGRFTVPCTGSRNYIIKIFDSGDLINPLFTSASFAVNGTSSCLPISYGYGFLNTFPKATYEGNTYDLVLRVYEASAPTVQIGPDVLYNNYKFPDC